MKSALMIIGLIVAMIAAGCSSDEKKTASRDTVVVHDTTVYVDSAQSAAADTGMMPITLPVLDAFFADSSFAGELRAKLGLSDAQIDSLRRMARDETAKLRESDVAGDGERATAAQQLAASRIDAIIGAEKGAQLMALVSERWGGRADSTRQVALSTSVPTDTRIVINAPAYRMDLFENGKLTRTFTIGIGYPEFPLPTGLRSASEIIFNPSWIPPDEPWVESSSKVKVGKKVEAGSKLNPLGIAKIPIGLPSLIHGGKAQSQLGGFASHGCAGVTDRQMHDFTMELARVTGTELTDSMIDAFGKNRSHTQIVALKTPVPVELRYQTIMVDDGRLHIYRDVYAHNTNTEVNLRNVLAAYNVKLEQFSDSERTRTMAALRDMSRDAMGHLDSAAIDSTAVKGKSGSAMKNNGKSSSESAHITRTVKGEKEIVIPVAALKGKGYPVPMETAPPPSKQIAKKM
jgi:lipoprotein-anchoring transpeptidase ErfK/SrfK